MHVVLLLRLLTLLTVANGAPVVATRLLRRHGAYPVDAGARWMDGQPLLGASKTIRGLLASIIATVIAAAVVGLPWTIGTQVSVFAMIGDLGSSFTKRRLHRPPGSRATGVDQIPESLLPTLVSIWTLSLTAVDVALCVAFFFLGEIVVSRLLYRLHVRDRPY